MEMPPTQKEELIVRRISRKTVKFYKYVRTGIKEVEYLASAPLKQEQERLVNSLEDGQVVEAETLMVKETGFVIKINDITTNYTNQQLRLLSGKKEKTNPPVTYNRAIIDHILRYKVTGGIIFPGDLTDVEKRNWEAYKEISLSAWDDSEYCGWDTAELYEWLFT